MAINQVTNKIYVPNEGHGTVTVIDGATNQAQTVTVGGWPGIAVVNSRTNKIYVGHRGGHVVSVIDGMTNTVASIPVGSSSWGVAVNETTNKVYVPSEEALNIIDGKNNAVTVIPHSIKGYGYRYQIVVNPVTNKAYFGGDAGFLAEFDGATNAINLIEKVTDIDDLALNIGTNKVYASSQSITSGSRLLVVDGATRAVHSIQTGRAPALLGINEKTNTIFALHPNSQTLVQVDGVTETQKSFPANDTARGIAVNATTNKVYVASSSGISVYTAAALTSDLVRTTSTSFHELAINEKTNRIYATNGYTATVIDGTDKAPQLISPPTPSKGRVGSFYTGGFGFSGSLTPKIQVVSGSLPPGLTLVNGVLSGVPTTAGVYSFRVSATNGISPDAITPMVTITIAPKDIRADYNSDGKPDVLARDTNGNLWLYPGNGSGGWLNRTQVGQGWSVMTEIAAPGDFTGDGKDDLLARDSSDTLWLYPGDGHGGWLARSAIGWGWGVVNTMFPIGDLDLDGNADIIGRTNYYGSLIHYRGNGSGGWAGQVQIGRSFESLNYLGGIGDINGNGTQDLIGRDTMGTLWLYWGGSGALGNGPAIGWGWNAMTAIATPGDFNGDGNVDLLARDSTGTLWLYPGNGKLGWLPRVQVGSGWNVMNAII
ncbi:FG-GAP-like repeat-containing protein [Paenarthrobacter sp. NPDC092416]|uniref:FG-GAP-like repeat-containing protein n=1 Tax=Paenarthrobacter sp. NPDC092416 TaxID=3364386 RepID=UPI0037FEEA8E